MVRSEVVKARNPSRGGERLFQDCGFSDALLARMRIGVQPASGEPTGSKEYGLRPECGAGLWKGWAEWSAGKMKEDASGAAGGATSGGLEPRSAPWGEAR